MGGLASWIRHDLKAPLAVISGYLELLEDDLDDASRREAMRRIAVATKVLGELIDDAGAWVLVETGALERELVAEPIELADVADGFVDHVEQSHPRLVVAFEGTLTATGDADFLRHALRLVVAAVDVSAPRGSGPEVLIRAGGGLLEILLEGAELGPTELAALRPGARPDDRPGRMLALAAVLVAAQGGTVSGERAVVRIELPEIV